MLLSPWLAGGIAGLFGLLIGSFLNVVIYRLPKMMEAQWAAEYASFANPETSPDAKPSDETAEPFNLMVPRSRCGNCGHRITWYENIPLLSFAFLRGKCSACGVKFGIRYPLVELATGLLFFYCGWKWNYTFTAAMWCGFSAAIVALAMIDWDTTLLPDDITYPLLWAGLLGATFGLIDVPIRFSIIGAAAGYLSLWTIYWAFKLATGKEGMGFGDFKLFAALGAWFGWPALIPMILMASVIGAIFGIAMKLNSSLREGGYVPFGPFLAGAGLTAMIFGPDAILRTIGLG